MTCTYIELTEDQFDDQYPLVANHLNPTASWGFSDTGGCLFETYGPELDFVRQQDPANIWTLIDGDDGDMVLVSGYHLVNRVGYLISTIPVPPGTSIEVRITMSDDSDTLTEWSSL